MISCYNSEVVVDSDNANSIELNTRSHTHDDDQSVIWFCERRKRITSSNAKSVAKRKSTTPVAHLVNQLLYSTFRGNSATRWGLQQEEHSVSIRNYIQHGCSPTYSYRRHQMWAGSMYSSSLASCYSRRLGF